MFTTITMINYQRPLRERATARKSVGPYMWSPCKAGNGRGFYHDAKRALACDPHGSTFRLRLELANEFLHSSLSRIDGYYADNFQDTTLTPIIARLPKGRGFLAGWTMGRGMCATLDGTIYTTALDAAIMAHREAEHDAERERDYQATHSNDDSDEE